MARTTGVSRRDFVAGGAVAVGAVALAGAGAAQADEADGAETAGGDAIEADGAEASSIEADGGDATGTGAEAASVPRPTIENLAVDQEGSTLFTIVCIMRRKEGITHEEFIDYYDNQHLPLMTELTIEDGGINPLVHRRHYIVQDDPLITIGEADTASDYDVVCEVVYRNRDEAVAAMTQLSGSVQEARTNDELNFLDQDNIIMSVANCHDCIGA